MNINIVGTNIEITEGLKNAIYERASRLEKYFQNDVNIKVILTVNKDRHKIEITIPYNNKYIRSEQVSSSMYTSIDYAFATIERQIIKYKNKVIDKKRVNGASFKKDMEVNEDCDVNISKNKTYELESYTPEDACIQMELLGHDFYIFVNENTNEVNVVYKKKDDTYGLIETIKKEV